MARVSDTANPEKLNRIVEGTVIEGEIKSESNIRIDGHVKGKTITQGRLVIGPNGTIEGEVHCKHADIEGALNGKITVSELLSLKASSNFNGDIVTKKLAIEPGAIFNGSCTMGAKVKELLKQDETVASPSPGNNGQAIQEKKFAKAR